MVNVTSQFYPMETQAPKNMAVSSSTLFTGFCTLQLLALPKVTMTMGGKHFELDLGHSGNHNSTSKKTVMKEDFQNCLGKWQTQ